MRFAGAVIDDCVCVQIMPLKGLNEVTWHGVSVMYTHKSIADEENAVAKTTSTGGSTNVLRDRIMAMFEAVSGREDRSLHRDQIVSMIPDCPEDTVRGAIEFMVGEGHLFTTVTDDVLERLE